MTTTSVPGGGVPAQARIAERRFLAFLLFIQRTSVNPLATSLPGQQRTQDGPRVVAGGQVGQAARQLADRLPRVLRGGADVGAKMRATAKWSRVIGATAVRYRIESRTITGALAGLAGRTRAQSAMEQSPFDGPQLGLASGRREATALAALGTRPAGEQGVGFCVEGSKLRNERIGSVGHGTSGKQKREKVTRLGRSASDKRTNTR